MKFLRLIVCIVCVFIFTKSQAQESKWRLGLRIEWKMNNAGTLDLGMSYHLPLSYTTNKFYENLGFQSTPQSPNFAKMSYVAFDVIYYF